MDNFITYITNNWQSVSEAIFDLVTAIGGIILLFHRTGTKRINRKIDEHVIREPIQYDLSKYDIEIDGKRYDLSHAKIKEKKDAYKK